jgi:hypothetical protein
LLIAIGDLCLLAYYYLLRVGEYTIKGSRNDSKQTQQFKVEDANFFKKNEQGKLSQLPWDASDEDIMTADSLTLKLDNQKNGWKAVCIHQEANGNVYCCPVRAGGRRVCHIRTNTSDRKTFLSAYFVQGIRHDVKDQDIRENLKWAATELQYPAKKGIPIERIDTHSLRSGGANALSLSGYSDREIMKMGRWRSATFMEYIREELACFSSGMSTAMKRTFNFVNIAGGAFHDVTSAVLSLPMAAAA